MPEGYIAFVEELPGANTQGATLDEARGRAWIQHNVEEVGNFESFLPQLYAAEA